MATVKGVVEAVSTKFGKFSIMVNSNWYATKMEWATVQPNKGDLVEFDDGGGKFLKKVKITGKGSGEVVSFGGKSSGGSPTGKTWNNLGVELGHASNIAKDITFIQFDGKEDQVGSEEFFQKFVDNTEKVFRVMKMLRTKYEAAEAPVEAPVAHEPAVPEALVLDGSAMKDIFK